MLPYFIKNARVIKCHIGPLGSPIGVVTQLSFYKVAAFCTCMETVRMNNYYLMIIEWTILILWSLNEQFFSDDHWMNSSSLMIIEWTILLLYLHYDSIPPSNFSHQKIGNSWQVTGKINHGLHFFCSIHKISISIKTLCFHFFLFPEIHYWLRI